ncbi:MAG: cytochrome c maturation protein CcmE [Bacteroidota bacterium]
MKPKTLIGAVLMAGFAGLLFMSFGQQVGGYMGFEEATDSGSRAHVVGMWVKDQPYGYDTRTNVFSFMMADENGAERRVLYYAPKPANFEDAEKVVVEGQMRNGEFVAEHILIKCPSKYNDEAAMEDLKPAA